MSDGGYDAGDMGGGFSGGGDFSERTSQSWFSRLGNAIKGILVGLVLFVVAFPLLFWNEGRAVQDYMGISEGKKNVISIPADKIDKVDPTNEHKLVHLSGKATTEDNVTDGDFGIDKKAIRLERQSEIYQWEQKFEEKTQKKIGGGTETIKTPVYSKIWSTTALDSSSYKDPSKRNTGTLEFPSQKTTAAKVTVGAFVLPAEMINSIPPGAVLSATTIGTEGMKSDVKTNWKPAGEYFYRGTDSSSPQIGDQRVKFVLTLPQDVSLYGEQVGNTFQAFQTQAKTPLERLEPGIKSADQMFAGAQSEADMLTWILRLVGFILMAVGVYLIFNPLVVFADVLPIFGNFLSMGIGLFAFLVAAPLTLLTIAIAWIFYRPILGVSLLVGVVVLVGLLFYFRRPKASRIATPPSSAS